MLADMSGVKRSMVAVAFALLVVGLIFAVGMTRRPRDTASAGAVDGSEPRVSRSVEIAAPEEAFDFLDHELRYAGDYGTRPRAAIVMGAAFDFVDHELRYAGDYSTLAIPAARE